MFALDGSVSHATGCTCGGCSEQRPLLWSVYGGLFDLDPTIAKKVMKADGEDQEQDPFLSEEMEIALLLAILFMRSTDKAAPVIDAMFKAPVTQGGIMRGLDEMGDIFSQTFDAAAERDLSAIVDRILINGVLDSDASVGGQPVQTPASVMGRQAQSGAAMVAAGTVLENAPSAALIRDGIVAATKYYTNNYFNTFIVPEIVQRIELLLAGTPFNEVPALADLRAILDRRLRTVPYWRLVANAAASRGYHYGFLKAAEFRGIVNYMFRAVVDAKTSEICLFMNGRTFNVSTAVRLMERVAEAPNVEAVKEIMPWRKLSDIRGLTTAELEAQGVMVPPLHGNCRSTLVVV